jgi:hypothetical protein
MRKNPAHLLRGQLLEFDAERDTPASGQVQVFGKKQMR